MPGLGAWGRERTEGGDRLGRGKRRKRIQENLRRVFPDQSLMGLAFQLTGEAIHSVPATTKKTWPPSLSSGSRTGRRRGEHDEADLRWKMGGSKNEAGTSERPVICHARNLCWRQEGVPGPDTTPWLRPDVIDGGEGQGRARASLALFLDWRRPTATGPASVSWRRRPEREISSQGPASSRGPDSVCAIHSRQMACCIMGDCPHPADVHLSAGQRLTGQIPS